MEYVIASCIAESAQLTAATNAIIIDHAIRTSKDNNYLTRSVLKEPNDSAWRRVYATNDIKAYRTVLGFDPLTFHRLSREFAPLYEQQIKWRPGKPGRPPSMTPDDVLGAVFMWLTGPVNAKHLQLIFGIVPMVMIVHYDWDLLY
jgi:hypothetical protein